MFTTNEPTSGPNAKMIILVVFLNVYVLPQWIIYIYGHTVCPIFSALIMKTEERLVGGGTTKKLAISSIAHQPSKGGIIDFGDFRKEFPLNNNKFTVRLSFVTTLKWLTYRICQLSRSTVTPFVCSSYELQRGRVWAEAQMLQLISYGTLTLTKT